MVRVLRISKLRRNSNISKSKPLPGRGLLSDAVTLSSLKLSYVYLRVRSSFLKNDNRDCHGPPYWRVRNALRQDKQRANTTNNGNLLCPLLPVRLRNGLFEG